MAGKEESTLKKMKMLLGFTSNKQGTGTQAGMGVTKYITKKPVFTAEVIKV